MQLQVFQTLGFQKSRVRPQLVTFSPELMKRKCQNSAHIPPRCCCMYRRNESIPTFMGIEHLKTFRTALVSTLNCYL